MAQRRRRSPSHRSRRQAASRKKSPPEPAPLLVVDQTPILKKALAKCRRLRTELHKKQEQLRRFEEEDQPAYQRWMSATFGARLTEVRELREQVADWEFIREQLSCCEFWMPEKLREVHDELMQRLKDGTLHAFEPPRPDGEEEEEEGVDEPGDDDGDGFDFDRFFEKAFDEFFGGEAEPGDDEDEPFRPSASKAGRRQPADPEAAARKALYRTLAKRLHPDHSDLDEDIRERRWNELQAAYETEDLAALQRIEAVCDMEVGGLSLRLGLARLRDLAAYHQSHLRPIRQALKEAKRDPAFGFDPSKPDGLKREVEGELTELTAQLRGYLELLRVQIRDLRDEADTFEAFDEEEGDEPDEPEADDHDFWADYTAWRDEELRKQAAGRKG